MTSDELNLLQESGAGKLYDTGDEQIYVLQLSGSWYEMGQQYGELMKDKVDPLWNVVIQSNLDKGWTTEDEARELFGKRVYEAASERMKALYRGVADGLEWPVDKVVLLDQGNIMNIYQGKLHSFAGCSSMCARHDATPDAGTYLGRNLDWNEHFLDIPVVLTVYNPTDGSNSFANLSYAGWICASTLINDKGVYADVHDGTSMGGAVVAIDRPSFLLEMMDFVADCSTAEAMSYRFNGTLTDAPIIWLIADKSGECFSYETTLYEHRRRDPDDSTFVTVNTFMNPDWGLHKRDTVSNSLTRYKNLTERAQDSHGEIDSEKMMEIFDTPLFNEDGTFREHGGATKPTKQDADLTTHQIVTDLNGLDIWVKIPLRTEWRHVDLSVLFNEGHA
ncbi:C45 family autoproteolytic acyltransferase/hydolase [Haloferax sp. DFSO52]|uniref:C45 family autoproteolytic acyltransferase/hydolase n=1 Tax=Haloferax sp. DFSO52 TaxID=3388505 RepID=UPI003A88C907